MSRDKASCRPAVIRLGPAHMQVAFIFTDAEVKDEAFLEYINQLLMTGEVAGLFAKDEIDQIVNDIRPIMRAESPGNDPITHVVYRSSTSLTVD